MNEGLRLNRESMQHYIALSWKILKNVSFCLTGTNFYFYKIIVYLNFMNAKSTPYYMKHLYLVFHYTLYVK